jgi:hypothetical protein
MKKANNTRAAASAPRSPRQEADELLPHYDFSKMTRAKPPRRLREGERVEINGAPFIVRGREFVPAPEEQAVPDSKLQEKGD